MLDIAQPEKIAASLSLFAMPKRIRRVRRAHHQSTV
jgi:hypothetical protein